EQGAGDQGMMFGYATDETEQFMPITISLAHGLAKGLATCRKSRKLPFLRPDGKSQVTVEFEASGKPKRVDTVVIAAQHHPEVSEETLLREIKEAVIEPVCGDLLDSKTNIIINGTGRFVIGGPHGDTGLTGRKVIVDTYGGVAHSGGGAFSGKDPSKVDRSASYAARYVAKNIVASGFAKKVEIQIAYCIGKPRPLSIYLNTYGTGTIADRQIKEKIEREFDFRPGLIIKNLNLKRPIYRKTTNYGHFGRNEPEFTWEKTDLF
ncbi:MAG TPA: methionine adenosyltransferase, partial [Candidatus Hodarchaeales archaeon]|nr:methionine adenosyltransferase [Candidatus Hodarchaeales archaeon]